MTSITNIRMQVSTEGGQDDPVPAACRLACLFVRHHRLSHQLDHLNSEKSHQSVFFRNEQPSSGVAEDRHNTCCSNTAGDPARHEFDNASTVPSLCKPGKTTRGLAKPLVVLNYPRTRVPPCCLMLSCFQETSRCNCRTTRRSEHG